MSLDNFPDITDDQLAELPDFSSLLPQAFDADFGNTSPPGSDVSISSSIITVPQTIRTNGIPIEAEEPTTPISISFSNKLAVGVLEVVHHMSAQGVVGEKAVQHVLVHVAKCHGAGKMFL